MAPLKYLWAVIAIAVVVGVVAFVPIEGRYLQTTSTSNGTSSTETGSSTVTLGTTVTTVSRTGSNTSSVSTVQTRTITADSFNYAPGSPVKVLGVLASTSSGPQGTVVTFYATYENVGSSDIYYISGCGSSLGANVTSGSGVIRTATGGIVCECAEAIMPLPPSGNHTAYTPGCWSTYHFYLVGSGSAHVQLTIYWGPTQSNQQGDATTIDATFTFS